MIVPTAVTIFLSLSFPELKGNTHTVVFSPFLSTTKQKEFADRDGWGKEGEEVLKGVGRLRK